MHLNALYIAGKIQSLKKSIPKGDKRKKREVTSEITKLEQEMKTLENMKARMDTSSQRGDGDVTIATKEAVEDDVSDIQERLGGADLDGEQEVGVVTGNRKKSRAQKRKVSLEIVMKYPSYNTICYLFRAVSHN